MKVCKVLSRFSIVCFNISWEWFDERGNERKGTLSVQSIATLSYGGVPGNATIVGFVAFAFCNSSIRRFLGNVRKYCNFRVKRHHILREGYFIALAIGHLPPSLPLPH